jgi:hypothetical protein
MRSNHALRAAIGGLTNALVNDPKEYTKAARQAFNDRFFNETDSSLPLAERYRQADILRRLYFRRMALKRHGASKSRKGEP